jgi:hypothetical protein
MAVSLASPRPTGAERGANDLLTGEDRRVEAEQLRADPDHCVPSRSGAAQWAMIR